MPQANGTDAASPEPSETEPCMEGGAPPARPGGGYFLRTRSRVCERWKLTHPVFHFICATLGALLLLLVLLVALGALWPRLPHSKSYPVCRSPECLMVAAQVRESMNDSTSPCADIWQWACGGWLARHPRPRSARLWNRKEILRKQETETVRDLIATLNLPIHTSSVEWKLKHLYGACLDLDNVNTDEARPIKDIIANLGGWYILRDWNRDDFDAKVVMARLHVAFGASPFFRVGVEADPYSPGRSIIRISPAGLGLPDREYYFQDHDNKSSNAYRELIRDVVINLGATTSDAEKFGTNMYGYERRIAEITPRTAALQNPLITYNLIKISELRATILTIPFFDILSSMYPESNITESTDVIVTSIEYLREVSQIISSTDQSIMNGYLMWTLVRQYLPFLSEKFVSVVNNFNRKLFGAPGFQERWEFCANLARRFMSLAVTVLEEKRHPISEQTHSVISAVFHSIVDVVNKRIIKLSHYTDLYKHLKRKLLTLKVQIGLLDIITHEQYVKDYYTQLRIRKSNLFQSVKFGIEFNKHLEQQRLIKPRDEDVIINSIEQTYLDVTYSPSDNIVIIPRNLISKPNFESEFPLSVIYGRMGVVITRAVLEAVLPYNNFWTGDNKLLSPYHLIVNDSLNIINNHKECLSKYLLNLNIPVNIENETNLEMLKHLTAISIANQALTETLLNKEHIHQPALEELEDSAVYFLTYSQTQCTESTKEFQLYQNIAKFKLPQETLLKITWEQLSEFSESYECPFNENTKCSNLL